MTRLFLLIATIFLMSGIWSVHADSLTYQTGAGQYGPAQWGTMIQDNPDLQPSTRVTSQVFAGTNANRRFVIKFDSCTSPFISGDSLAGAIIDSVFFRALIATSDAGSDSLKTAPYKILQSWQYFNVAGGSPTWNRRTWDGTAPETLNWTNAGAGPTTSSSSVAAATSVALGPSASGWKSWNIDTSVFNSWVASPSTNYGFMFKCPENNSNQSATVASPGNATTANRPKSVVYFHMPNGSASTFRQVARNTIGGVAARKSVAGVESRTTK